MEIKQYYLGCLSHASYMVTDQATRSAIVVDPQRDVDEYLQDAAAMGVTIKEVVLTHFHADFVSGHLELQKRTGAPISLGEKARAEYDFVPRREGDVITCGNARLEVLETPGHTSEAISLVAYEGDVPKAVLTGDTLFAGDVGRPDLAVSEGIPPEELAGQLFDSLHGKLMRLPDDTLVYPAHGPGSLCGSGSTSGRSSTIGRERAENPMLQPADKATFVRAISQDLPELPPYFARDARLNRSERADLGDTVRNANVPLSFERVLELQQAGAQVLDARMPDDFAEHHLKNAVNVGLDGRFAQFAGSLLDPERPLVVIAPVGREVETITRLGRVGFENVAGYLEGGACFVPPEHRSSQARTSPQQLAEQLAGPEPPFVLDVRSNEEWRSAHLEGARHIPLTELNQRLDEIPAEQPVVVHCASGYRSSMAASVLALHGRACVTDLMGGIAAWQQAGLPVVRPQADSAAST